jgi:uncharacterized protein YbjT (DUF2867 family)
MTASDSSPRTALLEGPRTALLEGPRTALLAGATGLVGAALLALLRDSARYRHTHVLLRRPLPGLSADARVTPHIVDFAHLPDPLPAVDDVFIALGTTIKVAGSEAAFRRVDLDHVVATARAARAAGAHRLAIVSALGADSRSRVFYNRVKGDMQAAVAQLGYDSIVFAQPSLLIGDRAALGQPTRTGEVWAARLLTPVIGLLPRGLRPIRASAVASALIAATLAAPPGVRILSSGDMLQ